MSEQARMHQMQDLLRNIRRSCSCRDQIKILELKNVPFSTLAREPTRREGGGGREGSGGRKRRRGRKQRKRGR